jgi:zinc protease
MKLRTCRAIVSVIAALTIVFAGFAISAQQPLDRSKIPPPGKSPGLHVPVWIRYSLANRADLIVSEKRDLPLISFRITIQGGASQMESPMRRGLASLTASMMSEGTKTRDGEALSNAQQLLGTSININIGSENGSLAFQSTTKKFPQALDVLADMLLNSTFPQDALERLRAQRLVSLSQGRDQPAVIATRVFARILYGDMHPFGQNVTEASLKAITRDDVTAFHKVYFRPGRALITVVGDVNPSSAKATIEKSLAGWTRGGEKPAFSYPALPSPHPTTIFLVDKPGAAQSTFAIGNPGPPRNTPDYDALQVMNTILGGMFQSRLNANIREEKGYSYGVSSNFAYGKGPGAFRSGGDMVSAKTDAALVEFMKELRGIGGSRPVTDEELKTAKDSLIQRLPGTFESVQSVNNAIVSLWTQGLPDSYYQQYISRISAVKKEDVLRVAKQYIDMEHLTIVIVGDRASIEAPLRATGIAPIALTDIEGKTLSR